MYPTPDNLGSLKSIFKKVTHAVEKWHPRELDPSRLIKKYTSDQKKKAAMKELTRVDPLPKVLPPPSIVPEFSASAATLPPASFGASGSGYAPAAPGAASEPPYLLIGGIAVIGVALLLLKGKKR